MYQLVTHDEKAEARAKEQYIALGENSRLLDYYQLFSVLEELLKALDRVYIVIDALDECTDQAETSAFIEELCTRKSIDVRILASSNTTQSRKTEVALAKLETEKVYVSENYVNKDIKSYIQRQDLDKWEGDDKVKIMDHITGRSDGS